MNLIFDLGGVLMMHNMPRCIAEFQRLMGDNFPHLGLMGNGEGNGLMADYEHGLVTTNEFISRILPDCVPCTTENDILNAWLMMHKGIPAERLAEVHRLKKAGHTIYLLSNNNEAHWHDVMTHYDMSCFDAFFLSHIIHSAKPEKAIFEALVRETKVMPESTIFIDDIAENRKVGESFGWKTCASLVELLANFEL